MWGRSCMDGYTLERLGSTPQQWRMATVSRCSGTLLGLWISRKNAGQKSRLTLWSGAQGREFEPRRCRRYFWPFFCVRNSRNNVCALWMCLFCLWCVYDQLQCGNLHFMASIVSQLQKYGPLVGSYIWKSNQLMILSARLFLYLLFGIFKDLCSNSEQRKNFCSSNFQKSLSLMSEMWLLLIRSCQSGHSRKMRAAASRIVLLKRPIKFYRFQIS